MKDIVNARTIPELLDAFLDDGWEVRLFANSLGSYTAMAVLRVPGQKIHFVETDDFTPSKALYRLAEKATTGRIV